MKLDNSRFEGLTDEDYELWVGCDPDYEYLQRAVGLLAECVSDPWYANIMDLGCGSGVTAERLLRATDHTDLIAVDIHENFLEAAQIRLEKVGKGEFSLYNMDILEALADKRFQGQWMITSVLTVHNLDKEYRAKLFPALYGCLAKGGVLVLGDKVAVDDEVQHMHHYERWLDTLLPLKEMGREDLYQYSLNHEAEDLANKMTESELTEGLYAAGFRTVTISRPYPEAMHCIVMAR